MNYQKEEKSLPYTRTETVAAEGQRQGPLGIRKPRAAG